MENFEGIVNVRVWGPQTTERIALTLTDADNGTKSFSVNADIRGIYKAVATWEDLSCESNPVLVANLPLKVFWGDLHVHSFLSSDGNNPPWQALEYARDVSNLDFMGFAEHDQRWAGFYDDDLNQQRWELLKTLVRQFREPGKFVPFLGYEWSSEIWGHRTVTLKHEETDWCASQNRHGHARIECRDLDDLHAAYGEEALITPHHSGWRTSQLRWGLWKGREDARPRLVECISNHGNSLRHNGPRVMHNKPSAQADRSSGAFVEEAIEGESLMVGFMGGSDTHYALPGSKITEPPIQDTRYQQAIMAVYARELSREALWAGMTARHTYATTGARILLWTGIGTAMMGDALATNSPPALEVLVLGSDILSRVEVVRDGETIVTWSGSGQSWLARRVTDDAVSPGLHYYYVRVYQEPMLGVDIVGNEIWEQAWSSPIYVNYRERP